MAILRSDTPRRRAGRTAERGFTLIELLVVLAIIGLVIAGSVPVLLRSDPGFQAHRTAVEIETTLRQAREASIGANSEAWLEVDAKGGTYRRSGVRAPVRVPGGLGLGLVIARREQTGPGSGRIRFFADGTSTGGTVKVAGGTSAYAVIVDWLTGRVHVEEL